MVTMGGFTDTLSVLLGQMGGQQVVDQTGLKGNYELAVEISLADLMSMAQSQGFGLSASAIGRRWRKCAVRSLPIRAGNRVSFSR